MIVARGPTPAPFYYPGGQGDPPTIGIPEGMAGLDLFWSLAHELGHLALHTGRRTRFAFSKGEAQADRWAACALIPMKRILIHGNASLDAFIAALSAHYGDIPMEDCPERALAGWIAGIRLRMLR